jgi:hypothetical protein
VISFRFPPNPAVKYASRRGARVKLVGARAVRTRVSFVYTADPFFLFPGEENQAFCSEKKKPRSGNKIASAAVLTNE